MATDTLPVTTDTLDHVVRDPRYRIIDIASTWVEIERSDKCDPATIPALVVDFSRHGMQVRVAVPPDVGETVTLRLVDEKNDFRVRIPATVQWHRPVTDVTIAVGFRFVEKIDWETMGEMFLTGILNQNDTL